MVKRSYESCPVGVGSESERNDSTPVMEIADVPSYGNMATNASRIAYGDFAGLSEPFCNVAGTISRYRCA